VKTMFTGTGIRKWNTSILITQTFIISIPIDFKDLGYWCIYNKSWLKKPELSFRCFCVWIYLL
jgi:hypothetical protein